MARQPPRGACSSSNLGQGWDPGATWAAVHVRHLPCTVQEMAWGWVTACIGALRVAACVHTAGTTSAPYGRSWRAPVDEGARSTMQACHHVARAAHQQRRSGHPPLAHAVNSMPNTCMPFWALVMQARRSSTGQPPPLPAMRKLPRGV
jgi:hypothetical protein